MTRLFTSPLELYSLLFVCLFFSIAKTINTCLCMRYYWIFCLLSVKSLDLFHHPMNSTKRLFLCFLPFLLNCNWCILDLFHPLNVHQLLIVYQLLFLRHHRLLISLQQNNTKMVFKTNRSNFGQYFFSKLEFHTQIHKHNQTHTKRFVIAIRNTWFQFQCVRFNFNDR